MNPQECSVLMRWFRTGLMVIALASSGCAHVGRPTGTDLPTTDGRLRSVVFFRMVAEIDGETLPAFPSTYSSDSLWLALGGFSSGGRLEVAPQRFFSTQTRLDGWTYLLLEPGLFYLAPHPPQNEDAFTYDRSWKQASPCWHLVVPRNARVVYGGTLFVPGKGRWMMFGPRRMVAIEQGRLEVRNESALAKTIHEAWLHELGPLTIKLVEAHSPSDPIILETPPGR